ncbi:hypothetical protein TKK_0015485 [Trichogramma kaykai]
MERKTQANYNRDPPDIQNCKCELQSHLRVCKEASFFAESLDIYQAAKKTIETLVKREGKLIMGEKINDISQAKKSDKFWKAVKALQYKSCDNNAITVNEWKEYYRSLLPQRLSAPFQPAGNHLPRLDDDITYREIEESLKKMQSAQNPWRG